MTRGFKFVTPDNWLEPDQLSNLLVKLDHRDGSVTNIDGRDWITYVNSLSFLNRVPTDVVDAYQFAIGAVGYAYFYYPLFTIVAQQILRVADFAVERLFAVRGDLPKAKAFDGRLKALKAGAYLGDTGFERWDHIRGLRNDATHPEWQQTWGPSGLDTIIAVVELISALPWPSVEERHSDGPSSP
jgi:hypothetical protein